MSKQKWWEAPLTPLEWIGIALAVFGALLVGSILFFVYLLMTIRF
jgi:hypothetical protein